MSRLQLAQQELEMAYREWERHASRSVCSRFHEWVVKGIARALKSYEPQDTHISVVLIVGMAVGLVGGIVEKSLGVALLVMLASALVSLVPVLFGFIVWTETRDWMIRRGFCGDSEKMASPDMVRCLMGNIQQDSRLSKAVTRWMQKNQACTLSQTEVEKIQRVIECKARVQAHKPGSASTGLDW